MKYVIKNVNGVVFFECEADTFKQAIEIAIWEVSLIFADLRGANLSGADLSGVNLYGANLYNTILRGANLSGADLSSTELAGANLSDANLSETNFFRANLSTANLLHANLSGANLQYANFCGADLTGANLRGVDFNYTDFSGAKFDDEIPNSIRVVPKEGEFIGWKKCRDGIIVKLLIPADAKRSNAFSRKCRASKAIDLEVIGREFGVSIHNWKTTYRVGDTVYPDYWDPVWSNECSTGIHFFMTRGEAEKYLDMSLAI